jgi:hypothetical protein
MADPKLSDPRLRDHRLARESATAELLRRFDALVADRDDVAKLLAGYELEIRAMQMLLHRSTDGT